MLSRLLNRPRPTAVTWPVLTDPFPYIYVRDAISQTDCDAIRAHWPPLSSMAPEEGLERNFFELVHDDARLTSSLPRDLRKFWDKQLVGLLGPVMRRIGQSFAPWISAKLGGNPPETVPLQIHRLMCLEAEKGFVEHTPHSHSAAPEWVFTMLLYVDDSGRGDRGTTLYRRTDIDFDRRSSDMIGATGEPQLERAIDAPFGRGAMLAFFDSPLSFHGSTPFDGDGGDSARKIIRAHVSIGGLGPRSDVPVLRMISEGWTPGASQTPRITVPALA